MSDSCPSETIENAQEVSVKALIDEEFKTVFGGTKPVTVPWAGLMYI